MPNQGDPAAGTFVKIERAKEHVRELEALIKEFLQSAPYQVVTQNDPETGDLVCSVRVLRQPPLRWSAILGDAIHNLRSSLDLLVCEVVRVAGGVISDQTSFPIGKDVQAFKSMLSNKTAGVPKDALRLIKAQKPYKGGNNPLWQLHRLDVIDKHRLLLTVGSAHKNVIVDFFKMHVFQDAFPDADLSLPLAINPADRQWPLSDGAVLFRGSASAWDSGMPLPQFTFEIAFGDGEDVRGKPVVKTLDQLVELVEKTVDPFMPLLGSDR